VDDLLLKGADVNAGNNHRNTALHLAAQNGWTDIARKLLRHRKIEVDKADLHSNTALHLAAQNGQIGVRKTPSTTFMPHTIICLAGGGSAFGC